MTRRVFLHIGTPKSGTSYLQDKLAVNRDLLDTQGVRYLRTRSGDHFEAAIDLIEKPWGGELSEARGSWDSLAAQARRAQRDVIISHEVLAAATTEQVARALGSFPDHEVHVVLTARDLARQIPAEWQEKIKHRGWAPLQVFLDRLTSDDRAEPKSWFWQVQDLQGVLSRWGADLPADRVHLVTVPQRGASPTTLWDRYGQVLGIDAGVSYAESAVSNASLGIAEIRALRRLNFLLHEAGVSRQTYVEVVREHLVREVWAQREDRITPSCPPVLRPWVEEITAGWTEWIQARELHVVGDLADLTSHWGDPAEYVSPDDVDRQDVVDAAVDALAATVMLLDQRAPAESIALPVPVSGAVQRLRRRWTRR